MKGMIWGTLAVLFLFLGCGGRIDRSETPMETAEPELTADTLIQTAADHSGELIGYGEAKASTLDLARTLALARARLDLAEKISRLTESVDMGDEMKSPASGLAVPSSEVPESDNEQTGKVLNLILKKIRTKKIDVLEDGTVKAWVILPIPQKD